ncbi:diphthamide biosynthesis enzyme Dph2 [Thermoplasmatales archaeon ex4572_165]|nr:MAG: diphthamide biosynthesis enzyme Dph2 [Thermoplasmatales archaeon ex4572_165]
MKISNYTINLERAAEFINKNNSKLVALQIPEGLKENISNILDYFQKNTKSSFIIYEDPCFGACDLVGSELKEIGVDLAIQIGHTIIPSINQMPIKTLFLNAESNLDVEIIVKESIKHLNGKKIGIVTTAQHRNSIERIIKILKENDFEPVIGKGDNRIDFEGQILGCNLSSAVNISENVDIFLYVGSGIFHPLGLILATKKEVIVADPYENKIKTKELYDLKDKILRQRFGAIERSRDAALFGILIGTKIGQQRKKLAFEIKEKLDSKNKKSILIGSNHFNPTNLETFRSIDCFISTACPRIAIDDYMRYKIPIITPVELDILLGFEKWEDYKFDEILDT